MGGGGRFSASYERIPPRQSKGDSSLNTVQGSQGQDSRGDCLLGGNGGGGAVANGRR